MVNKNLGYIDLNKKVVEPVLYLNKPNRVTISIMSEAFNIRFNNRLGALNELSFRIPVYIDNKHNLVKNRNFEIIKGRYNVKLVLGGYEEYFVINSISKVGDNDEYLDVKALSLGIELNDKNIREYEVVSYNARELLSDMLKDTIWNIGYIDSEFELKYRQYSVSSSTVLECIFDIAETFNAIVVWDTINREINLYRPQDVGDDKGFTISYEKYLESVNQEENSEEIVTRLKMFGKENISIQSVNPTGTNYVEDLTYFLYPYEEVTNYSKSELTANYILEKWNDSDNWINDNGELSLTSNVGKNIIYSEEILKNFKITGEIIGLEDNNSYGIVFGYKNESNYYYVEYGYNNAEYNPNNIKLFKVDNGTEVELSNSNGLIDGWSTLEGYRQFSVEVDNNLIKVFLDNVLVLYFIESNAINGHCGFVGFNQKIKIKNIQLEKKDYEIIQHSEYMSDELAHHTLEYDRLLQEHKDSFSTLTSQKLVHQEHETILSNELFELETQMKILLDERDVLNTRIAKKEDEIDKADNAYQPTAVLEGERDTLILQRDAKLLEISSKQSEIDMKKNEIISVQTLIDGVDNDIDLLRIKIDIKNSLPKYLLEERSVYELSRDWQNENIENPEDLLAEGLKVFEEYRKQKVETKINIVNFLSMITEQRNWDKLNLGDEFKIEHERLGIYDKAKVSEIDFNFDNNSIEVTITNVRNIYSNKDKYLSMLYKSFTTSTKVSMKEWEWNLSRQNNGMINQIINNFWDANKQAIIGAKDQVVEISDRGLIIRDPNNPLVYLVGINGMIAITNDGGNTWKHTMTSDGIVGEYIYGKVIMGVNLAIEDESGILKFQGSKGEIFDRNGNLVMKLGLVDENSACGEAFGLWSFNDITRVKLDDCEGFVIERADSTEPNGWEKVFWANTDGTLYSHDLVVSSLKVVSEKDWDNEILNAETGFFDIGWFKEIVKDGKLTTDEKLQIITELNRIYSGYKLLLSQASKYQRVNRDDVVDYNGVFDTATGSFPTTPSTIDRYSTAPLTDAYIDLIEYIKSYIAITSVSPHDPLTIDVSDHLNQQTQEVLPDRATFILKFKSYYDEVDKLKNAIEDAIVYEGFNMGVNYNNVFIGDYGFIAVRNDGKYRAFLNATDGLALQKWENNRWTNKVYASIGQEPTYADGTLIAEDLVARRLRIETSLGGVLLDADALNFDFSVLNSIILDDVIVATEKVTLSNQFASMTEQYAQLKSQISRYVNTIYNDRDSFYSELNNAKEKLETADLNLTNSYNALDLMLDKVFLDMSKTTHIINDLLLTNRYEFYQLFEDFYKDYEIARNYLEDFLEKSSLQLGRNYNNTVIDAENGVTVTRGDGRVVTRLNATDGISITSNGEFVFSVDTNGVLYAKKLRTYELDIIDGKIGEYIDLHNLDGITIRGDNGEVIRLNGNEGIAIDVNGDKRFWIGTDGLLYAKRLIVMDNYDEAIIDSVTGSYVSDLTVNKVKTLNLNNPNRYIHIEDDYIKFKNKADERLMFSMEFRTIDGGLSPFMQWGSGSAISSDVNVGNMWKSSTGFKMQYIDPDGNERIMALQNDDLNSIFLKTSHAIVLDGGTNTTIKSPNGIRFEVNASNYIDVTPNGVRIVGSRIDLN